MSPFAITRINDQSSTVARIAGAFRFEIAVQDFESRPLKTAAYVVTEGWFDVFGKPMALGRGILPEEHGTDPFAVCCVILSHRLWRSAYGADPSIVGKAIPPGLQVVGVTDPEFDYPVGADLWVPFRFGPNDAGFSLEAVGRLAPGATSEQARAEFGALAARFAEESSSFRSRAMVLTDLKESIVGDTGKTLLILLGAAATLLLIACANVMNLLLTRGAARTREIALRAALGAGRLRLVGQLLTESLVLAGAGALIGLAGAGILLRVLKALGPADLPRMSEIGIDGTALLFTVATTVLTAVVFGLLPALRLLASDLTTLLGGSSRGAGAGVGAGPLFSGLVLAQTTLAMTLVIGAGLLVRSYGRLRAVDPGFDADSVLVMDANLPQIVYPDYRDVARMYEELVNTVRETPGVVAAGAGSTVPLGESLDFMNNTVVVGRPTSDEPERTRLREVTPGFFDAMGMAIMDGRAIGADDRMDGLYVAVVNQTFVERFFDGDSPLGQRVQFPTASFPPTSPLGYRPSLEYEIVGVVRDARYEALWASPEPSAYLAHHQAPFRRMMVTAKIRGRDAGSVSNDMRQAFRDLDPTLPVEFASMEELVDGSLAADRFAMLLLLAFGLSATGLAAVGIYGVIALSVERRIPEMAIRTALGAEAGAVMWLCMIRGVALAGTGILLGVGGAFLMRRVMATQLFEVSATDTLVMVGAPVLLALVALISMTVPSFRATRLDLAQTLHADSG